MLVVDDDPETVEAIAAMLPSPGYSVVRAHGGTEAISLAQKVLPDLILVDLMMPDMSGFEVVNALRQFAATAGIPILVLTASAITAEDRAVLNRSDVAEIGFIEKAGLNRSVFLAEVKRALQNSKGGAWPPS